MLKIYEADELAFAVLAIVHWQADSTSDTTWVTWLRLS